MKNAKKLIKNLIIFIILLIVTFLIVFKDQDIYDLISIILNVNKTYVLCGIVAMALYFVFESLNVKCILKNLGENVKFIKMIRYSLVEFFFSGVTPAATGGQPMEIYYMHKEGVAIPKTTVALIIQLIAFQSITIVCGIIGAIINYNLIKDGLIWLFIFGISLNIIALLVMTICLFSNSLAQKIVVFIFKFLVKIKYKNADKLKTSVDETLKSYNESASLIRGHKSVFLKSFLIVACQVISYYSITYFVYKAFGLNDYSYFHILSIQAMLYVSVSSMPLPGAVGISEGAFLGIYNKVFGKNILSGATILNRTINFYFYIIIGLICTLISALKLQLTSSKEKSK